MSAVLTETVKMKKKKKKTNKLRFCYVKPQSPTFLAPGTGFMEDNFSMDWGCGAGGVGFRMIQVHYMCCAFDFSYYYISSTSGHQALDPGGWRPLM